MEAGLEDVDGGCGEGGCAPAVGVDVVEAQEDVFVDVVGGSGRDGVDTAAVDAGDDGAPHLASDEAVLVHKKD